MENKNQSNQPAGNKGSQNNQGSKSTIPGKDLDKDVQPSTGKTARGDKDKTMGSKGGGNK